MLTARCPSCSAPVRFSHAATAMAVCERCDSAVVRSGEDVSLFGKVAKFARDLSPIRVGAHGKAGSRGFTVAGVLRKGRKAVRWNEWFLAFDDGQTGWLAEGNGEWQIFDSPAIPANVRPANLRPGNTVELGERKWVVLESASAKVLAAEGELPFAVNSETAREYADLRSTDGRLTGTVDFDGAPAQLWTGRLTDLVELKLEGLRPIAGWSDPTLVDLSGPEIQAVRALRCPKCGASLKLRAPGQTARVNCEYCGSSLGLEEKGDASEAILLAAAESKLWKPALPLGKRGKLGGVEWELIGAMRRSVTVDGEDYPWVEYFLYNPYRGFAWLVDSNGHFNLVRRIGDVPRGNWSKGVPGAVVLRDTAFRHFQGGYARVRNVLGEFTWEVAVNDMAETHDFVAPPRMLSMERLSDEITWTLADYVDSDEVEAAFGSRSVPQGISPNQPNPYLRPGLMGIAWLSVAALLLIAVGIAVFVRLRADNELVLDVGFRTSPTAAEEIFLSTPFALTEDMDRSLRMELASEVPAEARVHFALLNQDSGQVHLYYVDSSNALSATLGDPEPGRYIARVEVARPQGGLAHPTEALSVRIWRDPPYYTPLWWLMLYALGGPIFLLISRSDFERRRWLNSDHAP